MKRRHLFIMIFGFLTSLIIISTVVAQISGNSMQFLSGDDCLNAHSSNYIKDSPKITYGGYAQVDEALNFSITYEGAVSWMVFSALSRVILTNSNLSLESGNLIQEKPSQDSNIFQADWIIAGAFDGNYSFIVESQLNVSYTRLHSYFHAVYNYTYTVSFSVKNGTVEFPFLEESNGEVLPSSDYGKIIFGQLLGFISIVFVYIVIQLGLPARRKTIRQIYEWTAAQLRKIHCNFGYLSIAAISLHAILLSQTLSWGNYFKWYTFYPQFLTFKDSSFMMLGLDLAGLSATIFILATLGGVFFKKIARRFGYKKALLIQQSAYFALVFAVLHALLNGSWTISFLPLQILQYLMVADVLINRLTFGYKRAKILLEKRQALESKKTSSVSGDIPQSIQEDL